jgi:hypothetical protein
MAANDLVFTYGNQVTLESNGPVLAANAFVAANDQGLNSTDHSDKPLGDFVLYAAFAAAPGNGQCVYLYAKHQNIDGANNAPDPSANYSEKLVGLFKIVDGGNAAAYFPCRDVGLAKDAQYWIQNGANQNLSSGWTLKVTPKTYKPATS